MRRITAAIAVSIVTLMTLSACTTDGVEFADLDLDPGAGPSLPRDRTDGTADSTETESLRWVGAHEGTDLWLGAGAEPGTVCLLVQPPEGDWTLGCGGTGLVVSGPDRLEYSIAPDGDTPQDPDAVAVSENVYYLPS